MLEPALPLSMLGSLGLRGRVFWCAAVPLDIMAILRMPGGCRLLDAAVPDRWVGRELRLTSDVRASGSDRCSSISGRVISSKLVFVFELTSFPRRTLYEAKGRLRSSSSVKMSRSSASGPSSSLSCSKPAKRLLDRKGRRIPDMISSDSGPLSLLPGYAWAGSGAGARGGLTGRSLIGGLSLGTGRSLGGTTRSLTGGRCWGNSLLADRGGGTGWNDWASGASLGSLLKPWRSECVGRSGMAEGRRLAGSLTGR